MKGSADFVASWGLPETRLALWASVLFSLSVAATIVSLTASQAFLAAGGVVYAIHLLRDRPAVEFPPVKLPLALFCFLTVLSILGAANTAVGWFTARKLVLFLILLLGVNLVKTARHLEMLFRAMFLGAAVAALVATGQFVAQYRAVRALHPEQIYQTMTSQRVHGFMGHWMNFGGQQMLVFAALLAYVLFAHRAGAGSELGTSNRRAIKIWWAVLAIITLSLVLNFTRGVWLGGFVASVYLVARWRRRWVVALPVLVLLGYLAAPSLLRHRLEVLRHPTSDPSLAIRFEMWGVALRMIQAHPWLGVGPNNIEQVYVLYLPPGKPPVVGYHQHFHSNFFQFGAERGLPCLAAWMWLMAAFGWHFAKIRRRLGLRGRPAWVAEAAIAGWLAVIVEGCFEFNFGTSPVLMVFLFMVSAPFVAEKVAGQGPGVRDSGLE